ncbi:MAG TPA: hypothetical protein VNQ76_18285, partial [Planctomicrobium sp.]|nr:hypothetical protein [Planctomicrobium sp.]
VPMFRSIQLGSVGASVVTEVQAGRAGIDQQNDVIIPATTTGGTFRLSYNGGAGTKTTAVLPYNASAGTVKSAIEAADPTVNVDVTLITSSPRTWRIKWGGSLSGTPVTLTADGTAVTGNASVTTTIVESLGGQTPAIWVIYLNWPAGSVRINGQYHDVAFSAELTDRAWWDARLSAPVSHFYANGNYIVLCLFSNDQIDALSIGGHYRLQNYLSPNNDCWQFVRLSVGTVFTFNGDSTPPFITSQLDNLQNVLANLPGIGRDEQDRPNVEVVYLPRPTGLPTRTCMVRFVRDLSSSPQPLLTVNSGDAPVMITPGAPRLNHVEHVEVSASGGTLRLGASRHLGTSTEGMDANNLQTVLLEPLYGAGNVAMTGTGTSEDPYIVTFQGDLAGKDIPQMIVLREGVPMPVQTLQNGSSDPGTVSLTAVNPGVDLNALLTEIKSRIDNDEIPDGTTSYPSGARQILSDGCDSLISQGGIGIASGAYTATLSAGGASIQIFAHPDEKYITLSAIEGDDEWHMHLYFDAVSGTFSESPRIVELSSPNPSFTGIWDKGNTAFAAFTPFVSTIVLENHNGNATQTLTITADYGTHTLSDGETVSSPLAWNANAATVQTALEGIYGAGNVAVTGEGSEETPFEIEFIGDLAGEAVEPIIVNVSNLLNNTVNEVQSLDVSPGGGLVDYYSGIEWTGNLPWNASAATVETALENVTLIGVDNVSVIGSGTPLSPYRIELLGLWAGTNILRLHTDHTGLTGGTVISVPIQTLSVAGRNAIQKVIIDQFAVDGTFRLALQGILSIPIPYNATEAEWTTALSARLGSGNVVATGTPAEMRVEFTGTYRYRPLPLMDILQDELVLSAGGAMTLATSGPYGPNHWTAPENWTLRHALTSGEIGVIGSGRSEILYGLTQNSRCYLNDLPPLTAGCTFAAGDTITLSGTQLVTGQAIRFRSGTFPEGVIDETPVDIDTETDYYVVDTGPTVQNPPSQTFKLSTTVAGDPIVFDGAGTGTVVYQSGDSIRTLGTDFLLGQTVCLRGLSFPPAMLEDEPLVLDDDTPFYIVDVQAVAYTNQGPPGQFIKISTEPDGQPIIFGDRGSDGAVYHCGVRAVALQFYARFSGAVGWPRRDTNGSWVENARHLSIDLETSTDGRPNLEIGIGQGEGARRLIINTGIASLDARIIQSQNGTDPAVQILNRNIDASQILLINGQVGLGVEPTEQVAVQRIVGFGGQLVMGNVDFKRREIYNTQVLDVNGQATGDVVEMRMR